MDDKKWWVNAGCPSEIEIEVYGWANCPKYLREHTMTESTWGAAHVFQPRVEDKCVVFVRSDTVPARTVEDAAYSALDGEASACDTNESRAMFIQGFLQGAKWKENQAPVNDVEKRMGDILAFIESKSLTSGLGRYAILNSGDYQMLMRIAGK